MKAGAVQFADTPDAGGEEVRARAAHRGEGREGALRAGRGEERRSRRSTSRRSPGTAARSCPSCCSATWAASTSRRSRRSTPTTSRARTSRRSLPLTRAHREGGDREGRRHRRRPGAAHADRVPADAALPRLRSHARRDQPAREARRTASSSCSTATSTWRPRRAARTRRCSRSSASATTRRARRARRRRSSSTAARMNAADHRGIAGNVVEFDGNLGLVIGAGGGSLTLFDAVRKHGGKPANYCEIGGNPSVAKARNLTQAAARQARRREDRGDDERGLEHARRHRGARRDRGLPRGRQEAVAR